MSEGPLQLCHGFRWYHRSVRLGRKESNRACVLVLREYPFGSYESRELPIVCALRRSGRCTASTGPQYARSVLLTTYTPSGRLGCHLWVGRSEERREGK